MRYWWPIVVPAFIGVVSCGEGESRPDDFETVSAEELFRRAGEAYRATPALEVTFTTVVEFPDADPGERVIRYILGEGNDAEVDIVSQMRIVATGDTVYIERHGIDDRYLAAPLDGDLGATLANMRGRASFAGARESPQGALRAGKPLSDVLEALRYSRHLGELEIVDSRRLPDARHEVQLQANNGSCTVRFDPESFFLLEVDYLVRPSDAPEDWSMKVSGTYDTRSLNEAPDSPRFEPDERIAVQDYQDLTNPIPGIDIPPAEIISPQRLAAGLIDLDSLAELVSTKRVLLVGEDHLYHEPPAYTTELLERLDDRPISLLMELPYDAQPNIERFLEEGDEAAFEEIFSRQVLQLQHLLRWARENRDRFSQVEAIDEPTYEIFLRRAYAGDTRNPTMAAAILQSLEDHPEARVVVYAGQLHMMTAGRYRWNLPSRDPVGARIIRMGVPRSEVVTIMLNGGDNIHLFEVWEQPGALPMSGDFARIPVPYFIDYPIFGATTAGELFDYFVNLGPLTRVEME